MRKDDFTDTSWLFRIVVISLAIISFFWLNTTVKQNSWRWNKVKANEGCDEIYRGRTNNNHIKIIDYDTVERIEVNLIVLEPSSFGYKYYKFFIDTKSCELNCDDNTFSALIKLTKQGAFKDCPVYFKNIIGRAAIARFL